jgi:hypothetical protein
MRVTFDFAGDMEVHYTRAVPEVGDFVTHQHEIWVVRKIGVDGVGPMITCEPLPPDPAAII